MEGFIAKSKLINVSTHVCHVLSRFYYCHGDANFSYNKIKHHHTVNYALSNMNIQLHGLVFIILTNNIRYNVLHSPGKR